MSNPITQNIFVRKDIKLATGESVSDFTKKLRESCVKWARQKLALDVKKGDIYPVEIFSSAVVFDVYKYDSEPGNRQQYFACKYKRQDTGGFEFESLMEVERVVSFQQKQNAPVMKSKGIEVDVEKAPLSTATINDLPDAAFAIILPGGKKDASGKTTPRNLRMLPHHTRNVQSASEDSTIDMPRLRNALARLNQAKLSQEQRSRASNHLDKHANAVLASRGGDPGKIDATRGNRAGAKPVKKALDVCDGWIETSKSFWNGVI
jgi:hypothetical protein